jgi:hypothetical protein
MTILDQAARFVRPACSSPAAKAVADSLEEAGDRLFTFTRLPRSQWKSARTTNAIERLHEEFKRRIKTQTVLPSAETAAMLFWALLASGQIAMRKVDGWQTVTQASALEFERPDLRREQRTIPEEAVAEQNCWISATGILVIELGAIDAEHGHDQSSLLSLRAVEPRQDRHACRADGRENPADQAP